MSYSTIDESQDRPFNRSDYTTQDLTLASWIWIHPSVPSEEQSNGASSPLRSPQPRRFDLFRPLRHRLDRIDVNRPELAHFICQLVPAQCPFERTFTAFGRTILRIPPLCKLNPVYDEVVSLRFRALCYLADVCGEDISRYC